MTFAWPELLWLLLLPAAWAGVELARRQRAGASAHPKILRAEAGARAISLAPAGAGGARRAPARGWLLAGIALGIVAVARPQWGRVDEPVFNQAREILIAIDLSRSMLSPDVKPSRLDRAKLLVQSLVDGLHGERVGLEAFAGTAFLQAPLSPDDEILREFLPALRPDLLPVGGTNYAALIDTAADAFGDSLAADRFLVVLSDGGATDDDWRSHVDKLRAKNIRVIGLGVGTSGGALMPDGAGGYVKDGNGAVVLSRLESDNLRELAEKTGGAYRDAGEWIDLPALLQATVEAGHKGKFVEKNQVRQLERYQWALAPALLCLLLSFWREFPVRPAPRDLRLGAAGGKSAAPVAGPAAAALVIGLIAWLAPRARADDAMAPEGAATSAPLAHIVGRIANEETRNAYDWAEFAGETADWGQRVQSAHQPVPTGPVHDGLAAVDAGSALNAKAADWPRLRRDLEALLQKQEPPPQKQPPKKQQQNQQNSPQSQERQQQQQNQNSPTPQNESQNQDSAGSPRNQSAFGGLDQPPPPPRSGGTQKVGGAPPRSPAEAGDPAIAGSLEKLDQVRNQDSPAELFQLIENHNPHPAPPTDPGKNW